MRKISMKGKRVFGIVDLWRGLWQLPMARFCQEWMSFVTDRAIYTPTRVPQGSTRVGGFMI